VFIKYPTRLHKKIEEKMEKFVLRTADYIITATEPMSLKLIEKYPFIKGKCATITNGFDSEDFEGLTKNTRREKFTIAFTGSLYGLRTSKHFLIALKELIGEDGEIKSKIQVVFAGFPNKQTTDFVNKLGLQGVIKFLGYVPHQESLKLMVDSDCLLLIIAPEEPYSYTGKLFEYLGAKRPILALIPPQGIAGNLIRSTKAGIIISPKDVNSIKQAIFKLFQDWKRGGLGTIQSDVSGYDRKVLTKKLAKVFEQVLKKASILLSNGSKRRNEKR
jgi:glycosyltransferase involved in cell wall biosynthesis